MKRIKMGLMALSAITSIGTAFASSPVAKHNANTYYAIKTGSGTFNWTLNNPGLMRKNCLPTATAAVCSITTANQPVNNQIPAGHSSTGQVYQ